MFGKHSILFFAFLLVPIIDGCLRIFFDESEDEAVVTETKIAYKPCPKGWKQNVFDDVPYCYLAVIGAYLPQSNAQKDCERHNSSLVSIHSEDEHNFVYSLTSSNITNTTVDAYELQTWIGLVYEFDADHLPVFSWLDGTKIDYPENYPFNIGGPNKFPWGMSEPNHFTHEEYCVMLVTNLDERLLKYFSSTWGDIDCNYLMANYVCKKQLQ